MNTLVIGASGATGKNVVNILLKNNHNVKVIIRQNSNIPDNWNDNNKITIIYKNISEITISEMKEIIKDCQNIVSCLGHNLSFKGIYGKPRKLVTNSVKICCDAIVQNNQTTKFILMNTAGNKNHDLNEKTTFLENIILYLIRNLLPPHSDNENAAEYLRMQIGKNNNLIEWVVVRPDTLLEDDKVTEYQLNTSPTTSAILKPGKTSRINVADFMVRLIIDNNLWKNWKGQMPVIYNNI
jgi:putative NADH-flavin reductase